MSLLSIVDRILSAAAQTMMDAEFAVGVCGNINVKVHYCGENATIKKVGS